MASNRLSNSDFENASAFNNALRRDFLQSERRVSKTSYNEQGVIKRTLSSRTLGDAFSGSVLIGNVDYNNIFMAKYTQSQLEHTIAAYGDSFMTGELNADGETVSLQGSIGFNNFMANTLLGKRGFQDNITFQDFLVSANTSQYDTVNSDSYDGLDVTNVNSVSSGSMEIALESILIERGIKEFYIERGNLLSQKMSNRLSESGALINGFQFDIPDDLTGLTSTNGQVSQSIVRLPQSKAFVSAALIELLIYLEDHSEIYLRGGFGLQRAIDSNIQGPNFSRPQSNDSISDHVFGRAFDIMGLSESSANVPEMGRLTANDYDTKLTLFLSVLENAPDHLKPDLIVVHEGLRAQYGITQGVEGADTQIKVRFPGLRHVNFHADAAHTDHIHISFSAARAGTYTGSGGQMNTSAPLTGSSWADVTFSPGIAAAISGSRIFSDPKFISSYANSNLEKLSEEDMFLMLSGTVFSPQVAAIFANMTFRESSNRPVAINGGWTSGPNDYLNSYAVGFLQINMRTNAHGGKYFYLPIGALGQPDIKLGWQLAVDPSRAARAPYNKTGLTTGNINDFLRNDLGKRNPNDFNDQEKVGIANPILWIPLNQAFMLPTVARGVVIDIAQSSNPQNRLGVNPEDGYLFEPWSDYGGGSPFVGFLFRISYEKVIQLCSLANVSENEFRNWFTIMMNSQGANSKARPYVDDWLSGKFFNNYNSAN
jgi:hypothetical protein